MVSSDIIIVTENTGRTTPIGLLSKQFSFPMFSSGIICYQVKSVRVRSGFDKGLVALLTAKIEEFFEFQL